jgi:hypothetical protein
VDLTPRVLASQLPAPPTTTPDELLRRATDAAYAAQRAAAYHRDVLLLDELTALRQTAHREAGGTWLAVERCLLDQLNLRIAELTRDLEEYP